MDKRWSELYITTEKCLCQGRMSLCQFSSLIVHLMGFPGEESTYQCRRLRFDPWFGKTLLRRKWQPAPVFLLGKSHGQRSQVGCSPWGHKEWDTTEQLSTHACILSSIIISHFYINFYCTDSPHGISYFQCKFYNEDFMYHFFCCSYQVLSIITSATVSLLLCLHPVIPDFTVVNFTMNFFYCEYF